MKNLKFITIVIILLLNSCASVEKYNAQVSKKHTPDELKQDVDYAYKKLRKLHPELYLYISKEDLDGKFKTFKKSLTKPMFSKDFYKQFTPVITSIKQGHTSVYPLAKIAQIPLVKNINGKPHFNLSANLKKPKEEYNFKGKIYVLINGNSFSASSVISNHLKATKRAFFVGDETGGAYNSTVAGQFANIILPYSKMLLYFGIANLETPHKTKPDGYGVKPDKYIEPTTIDKDEHLEWILNDIKSKK